MNREQLIKDALRDAAREGSGWPKDQALERWLDAKAQEVEAALAMFEGAYTPTGDEWEAIRRIIAQGSYSRSPEDRWDGLNTSPPCTPP